MTVIFTRKVSFSSKCVVLGCSATMKVVLFVIVAVFANWCMGQEEMPLCLAKSEQELEDIDSDEDDVSLTAKCQVIKDLHDCLNKLLEDGSYPELLEVRDTSGKFYREICLVLLPEEYEDIAPPATSPDTSPADADIIGSSNNGLSIIAPHFIPFTLFFSLHFVLLAMLFV